MTDGLSHGGSLLKPEKVDLEKIRSMMSFAIEAIGKGQFTPETVVHDRNDFGREFHPGRGLELVPALGREIIAIFGEEYSTARH